MDEILEILSNDARISPEEIAKMTKKPVAAVKQAIRKYEADGTIVQYKAILNPEMIDSACAHPPVRALIEVSIVPQKDVGFDRIAERIYSFDEVKSCHLVSGSYDLLLVVEGQNIQTVAEFVSSKLSSMENVRQTTTHFLLKKYKEDGRIFKQAVRQKRLNITY
ncbi:MAG: Lrp/AsnC family transcriptional regulator [Candidatus Omnitrophica bacterium]|nr:Lrp/AsnC family transcriptional regulator [Candidatus Omnitrophota bacterium]